MQESNFYLVYFDDSTELPYYAFSALAVPAHRWPQIFKTIKEWRSWLNEEYGIDTTKELHVWKFVSGRGNLAPQFISKWRRCEIFHQSLSLLASIDGLRLFNVFRSGRQDWAFERLINRINRTMKARSAYALLVSDEGKEEQYTRLIRRMSVFNPIPSHYGSLAGGDVKKSITIDRIIEDPFFKSSEQSYFIQLADFCAYALLRKERPLPSK